MSKFRKQLKRARSLQEFENMHQEEHCEKIAEFDENFTIDKDGEGKK